MNSVLRKSVFAIAALALSAPVAFANDTTTSSGSTTDTTPTTGSTSRTTGTADDMTEDTTTSGATQSTDAYNTDSTSATTSPSTTSPSSTTTSPSTSSIPSGATTTTTTTTDTSLSTDIGTRYQVVDFREGSSELTQAERDKLRTLIDNSKAKGQIAKLHVAVWSDKAFPKGGQDLNRKDRNLAKARVERVEKYLKDTLAVSLVETHNMAERAKPGTSTMSMNDMEIKALFSEDIVSGTTTSTDTTTSGTTTPTTGTATGSASMHHDFQVFKQMGGPGKAVVLVEMTPASTSGTTSGSGMTSPSSDTSTDTDSDSKKKDSKSY